MIVTSTQEAASRVTKHFQASPHAQAHAHDTYALTARRVWERVKEHPYTLALGMSAGVALLFTYRRWQASGSSPPSATSMITEEGEHGHRQYIEGSYSAQTKEPWDKKGLGRTFDLGDVHEIHSVTVDKVYALRCPNLHEMPKTKELSSHAPNPKSYANYIQNDNVILGDIVRKPNQYSVSRAYIRAGPRRRLYFEPTRVRAAIVTCGGLCPGLNNVIREIVRMLARCYGAEKVFGIRNGYNGFHSNTKAPPLELTPESVEHIQRWGGTILGSDRGGFDAEEISRFCKQYRVNQLYVLGGDGTHRGAARIHAKFSQEGSPIAVVGIPKTIDNDLDIIDRSFGFTTAVEEAGKAIRTAATEAECQPRTIGLVKLMGRNSGFIAAHSTLASGNVDLCLIPEVPIHLDGPHSILRHLEDKLEQNKHAVVVVAEGAGQEVLPCETDSEGNLLCDAGGNRKLPEFAPWLSEKLKSYFNERKKPVGVKYVDPSYIIRSVPANSSDALYCLLLGQNAVHAAMAGFSGISVALCNNRMVYIPADTLSANSPRVMDPLGRTWERIVALTHQPNTAVPLDQHPAMKHLANISTTARTIH
eukprot:gb/GECG01011486.1/.p1 GENE.gb/GECG01011486.1/~~gb/GECG01011486.1/.p1  ORF type:complete len:589 (+),score=45.47 gb/GECG01011486.1/:1-1767(+)